MQKKTMSHKARGFRNGLLQILIAIILALIIRSFIFQPFNIPSGSMLPTLLVGDYLFVSKYSYGYSRHSLPFSPALFNGRIFSGDIKRGDVAVFKLPSDGRTDYIKRVIGLPGDKIQMKDGHLYINNVPVRREILAPHKDDAAGTLRYRETLPNGVRFETLDMGMRGQADNTPIFHVPAGHYFMMGDNRDNSLDSRFNQAVGYVPYENFVGPARIIFFSFHEQAAFWQVWKWPSAIRWKRLFGGIS